jgi:hypothetical protein
MRMTSNRPGLKLGLMSLATLAACLTFGFTFPVSNSTTVTFTSDSILAAFPFDVANSQAYQDHKSSVSGLTLQSADVDIAPQAGNTAQTVTGVLSLLDQNAPLDAGCDAGIVFANVTNLDVSTASSQTFTVDAGTALADYLTALLLADGGNSGAAVLCGTATTSQSDGGINGDLQLTLTLHFSANYNWP